MKKSFKYLLTVIFVAVMLSAFVLVSFGASDLKYIDVNGNVYTYTNTNTDIVITGFSTTNTDVDLVIPDTIDGLPVVKIGVSAFEGQPLKSVYIPESISQIREYAFRNCTTLETLTFAEDIYCELFNYAFANCGMKELYVPAGISTRYYAFGKCVNLEKAELVSTRGNHYYIFVGCTSLREVTISTLAKGMFDGCENLEIIHSTKKFQQLPADVFDGCKKLTSEMLDQIIDYKRLTSIGGGALRGCTSLTYFNFSKFEKSFTINSRAFADCTGLEEIILPDNLVEFYKGQRYTTDVFGGCTGVKRLYLGAKFEDSPESIGITSLSGLESIEVSPENEQYFTDDGVLYFDHYGVLSLVKYPAYKQGETYSMANVIAKPDILFIYDYAFSGTKYLNEVEFSGWITIPVDTTNSSVTLKGVFENSSVEKVTSKDNGFDWVGENMFKNSQIREIDLKCVAFIDESAFENCQNLEKANLLSCTYLGKRAFANCPNLKLAIFGSDSVYIYNETFENDDLLTFYCSETSYAYDYAIEHNIPVNTVNINVPNNGKYPYTGKEISPSVIVSISGMTLTQGKDYTLQYSDNINVGTALVTVTFIGDFDGLPEIGKIFSIVRQDVSNLTVEYVEDNVYSGEEIRPAVVVKNGDIVLVEGVDYTITYSSKLGTGTMYFTIKGIGNYTGSQDYYYNITRRDIGEARVSTIPDSVYTGEEICPIPTLTWNGFMLEYGIDYDIQWFDNVNTGFGTMVIYGLGNFKGTIRLQFRIFGKDISSVTVSEIADQEYTGKAITPKVTVTVDGKTLIENVDYTVEYRNNIESGTASIIISGMGNYSGVTARTFRIYKNSVYSFTVFSETQMTATYDGTPLKPEMEVYFGTELLTEGVDYTVRLENNINAGTATVTICGIGRFEGERSYDFTILPCEFASDDISVSGSTQYNGSAIEPQVTVYKNSKRLENGTDYTVTYFNNIEVGTAYLTVEGIGNYIGTVNVEFEIYAQSTDGGNGDKDPTPTPDDGQNGDNGDGVQKPQKPDTDNGKDENTDTDTDVNKDSQNGTADKENTVSSEEKDGAQTNNSQQNAVVAPAIPNTDSENEKVENIVWIVLTVPLLIALNILDDKWRKKHGRKTFAERVKDAVNDNF